MSRSKLRAFVAASAIAVFVLSPFADSVSASSGSISCGPAKVRTVSNTGTTYTWHQHRQTWNGTNLTSPKVWTNWSKWDTTFTAAVWWTLAPGYATCY